MCDPVNTLWTNGYHSAKGCNDRIPQKIAEEELSSSLLFIKPDILSIIIEVEFNNKRKVRVDFTFKGQKYRLMVTDPEVEKKYLIKKDGIYHIDKHDIYLCISLSRIYEGYAYKLVGAVINFIDKPDR